MSNYFPLRPLGEGTEDIEHFHSYFYRYAKVHGTTIAPMVKHLEQWWNRVHNLKVHLNAGFLYKPNGLPLCGYGDVLGTFVKVVSEAAHFSDLYRTTLLPIRDAADAVAHGAIRKGRAWCPACLYWADRNGEVFYDKLLWAIPLTCRCANHQVNLVNTCHHCGAEQWAYQVFSGATRCVKCRKSLVQSSDGWVRNENPSFGERDILSLIKAIADGSLRSSTPRAFSVFVGEARALANLTIGSNETDARQCQEARALRQIRHMPTLSTMLKVCHSTGVRLADVLADPKGAAHAMGLLVADDFGTPTTIKPCRGEGVVADARQHLREAILAASTQELVPFSEFACRLGLSKGFLRYQEPKLCKVYVEEYRWQRRKEVERRTGLAKRELSVGKAFRRYLLGEFRSQDDLVDYIHEFSGAHKHVIRRLILAMSEDQRKIQVLSEKRRLTANEMKVLKRGLRNGYIKPVD